VDNLNDGFSPLQFETSAESNNAFSETSLIFKQFLVQYQQLATQIYVMHSTVQVRNEGRPGAGGPIQRLKCQSHLSGPLQ